MSRRRVGGVLAGTVLVLLTAGCGLGPQEDPLPVPPDDLPSGLDGSPYPEEDS